MDAKNRDRLDHRIRNFFVDELRKEFKDDFEIIASKVDEVINKNTIKDARYILHRELKKIKQVDNRNRQGEQ